METFDYIVVGAGSAGCVVAARLAEDSQARVLLVEAGGADSHKEIHVPVAFPTLYRSAVDWNFETEPQVHLGGRRLYWPRGKVLGGSSSINAMIYIRGNRRDYDEWRDAGNPGWGFDDVLRCFKRSENNERGASQLHGAGGPLNVADLRSPNPLSLAFLEGARLIGLAANADFNGSEQLGVGLYQVTQKAGARHSAARAYLPGIPRSTSNQSTAPFSSVAGRPNLQILLQRMVARVVFEKTRAVGVEVLSGATRSFIRAEREVILCGGAINSPQLLMLSGVGPAEALRAQAIPVVLDLPGVGANLQDHLSVDVQWRCRARVSLARAEGFFSQMQYLLLRRGPLTSNVAEAGGFVCTRPGETLPDIQFHFAPVLLRRHHEVRPAEHGFSCCVTLLRSPGRGRIALRSANPLEPPAIDPNYMADASDWVSLREGVRTMQRIGASGAFRRFGTEEVQPGAGVQTQPALDGFLRARCETLYHPVGTCKMGCDEEAVVDATLRVRGTEGLRVADASIMPVIPRGNTNAPAIMVAEKATEMIGARPTI